MEVQVVYEGVLELGYHPESTSSRDWRARLFVLKHDPITKTSSLDFYKDTKKRWQKQVAKGVISLWPSFRISLAHVSSYKFPIKLVTGNGHTFYFAAPDFKTMNAWYTYIQTQISLKELIPDKKGCREYRVQAVETDSAKLIGASGDCLLVLSKGELYCALASTHKILGVWPYDSLRRYYCIDDMFGFVAGRRSPRGEGEFKFVTKEKEDIYHRLERAILRAKRGSEGSTSSAEGSKDVDHRPPAPLPGAERQMTSPARQETPVPTSESDDEIFQSDPNSDPRSPGSAGGMKQLMTEPVASDISPAYGKFGERGGRGRGAGGRGAGKGQGTVWLHESVSVVPQPQEGGKPSPRQQHKKQSSEVKNAHAKRPPLPPSRNSQVAVASEEDTYSHTVHRVPEQFLKKTMEHNVIGGNIYNALVHQQSSPNLSRGSSRPSAEQDTNLYDVAFPQGRRVMATGDYELARHPDSPRYVAGAPRLPPRRMVTVPNMRFGKDATDCGEGEGGGEEASQSQEAKKPTTSQSSIFSVPLAEKENVASKKVEEDDDGLTANPMYGAQQQLLSDIAILDEQIREMELNRQATPTGGGVPSSMTTGEAAVLLSEGVNLDEAKEEFTVNPIYGDLNSAQKEKKMAEDRANMAAQTDRGVSSERERERASDKEESSGVLDNSLLSESEQGMVAQGGQQEGVLPSSQQASGEGANDGAIQRDGKGYSKVDKSKKANQGAGESVENNGEGERKEEGEGERSGAMPVPSLESQGSNDTDGSPPPLPERNYSFDESELSMPPTAGQVAES